MKQMAKAKELSRCRIIYLHVQDYTYFINLFFLSEKAFRFNSHSDLMLARLVLALDPFRFSLKCERTKCWTSVATQLARDLKIGDEKRKPKHRTCRERIQRLLDSVGNRYVKASLQWISHLCLTQFDDHSMPCLLSIQSSDLI